MNVIVHRGLDQIGGNIIEVSTSKTRILLDAGLELDAEPNTPLPHVEGLFDNPSFDAVFFSHSHLDHIGLAEAISSDIPLYVGERTLSIMQATAAYLGKPLKSSYSTYKPNAPVKIGDLRITPILIDHSAYDSYMLLVESGDETLLYTGDFRSTGRKSLENSLRFLPSDVDTLVCEGTNLGSPTKLCVSESDLESKAVELLGHHKGPVFTLQAASNIDRLVTMYRAAKRSGRVFYEDLYTAEIARAVAPNIPNPNFEDVRVFLDRFYGDDHPRYLLFEDYGANRISRAAMAQTSFVLCVRASMGRLLKSLSKKMSFEDGLLVYSMWSGYREKSEIAQFLRLSSELGLTEVTLHNSGHADIATIERLVSRVRPTKIIPVHTENADWWMERYPHLVIDRASPREDCGKINSP